MRGVQTEQLGQAIEQKDWNLVQRIFEHAFSSEMSSLERGSVIINLTDAILEAFTNMNNKQAEALQEIAQVLTVIEEGKQEFIQGLSKSWIEERIKRLQES